MKEPPLCEKQPPGRQVSTVSNAMGDSSSETLVNTDEITLAGSDERLPLRLYYKFIIQPNSSLWITSMYPSSQLRSSVPSKSDGEDRDLPSSSTSRAFREWMEQTLDRAKAVHSWLQLNLRGVDMPDL